MMDESELRQATAELLLVEILALIPRETLDALSASIREGVVPEGNPGHDPDEYAIRQTALTFIADAKVRHRLFTPAMQKRRADA